MKLLAVGDSFTYGEELADLNFAWPFLLGNKLGYEVTNLGKPSKSNDYIARTVVETALNYDLVIIAWSHYARMEFADSISTYDIWPGCNSHQAEFSKWRKNIIEYITFHHDDAYLYKQYLLNIILIQSYLEKNNKRYIMLDAFGNTKDRHLDTEISQQVNTTHYLGWPDNSMMEWTYGSDQGANGHFLGQGHQIVADKIYEHIRHLGWVS
jgi:lysophospholipase L1-like esterase